MTGWRRAVLMGSVLVACVGCDQATKRLAVAHLKDGPAHSFLMDTFRLQYAENPGAFLSLGASLPPEVRRVVFTLGVAALLVALAVVALTRKNLTTAHLVATAAFIGGGLGNLWDRVFQGGVVVDFMNLGVGPVRTGIFNVADLAIMAGAVLLAWPVREKTAEAPPPGRNHPVGGDVHVDSMENKP